MFMVDPKSQRSHWNLCHPNGHVQSIQGVLGQPRQILTERLKQLRDDKSRRFYAATRVGNTWQLTAPRRFL